MNTGDGCCEDRSLSQLVSEVMQGNRDSFSELACRHQRACLAVAMSILRNYDDAEDAVQNSLLRAFERVGQLDQPEQFSGWLLRIVRNECLMQLRSTRRRRACPITDASPDLASQLPSPEAGFLATERTESMHRAIRSLPALFRDAVRQHYLEQLPLAIVADRAGLTPAAVKSRLSRARRTLKAGIDPLVAAGGEGGSGGSRPGERCAA
jgi:RNA polymerase sigma-70 factor (ECF subfamily)